MKPELANLFSINTTGEMGDFVLSFFYEWHNTEDGKSTELEKKKVASIVLDANDFVQLANLVGRIKEQIDKSKSPLLSGDV